MSLRSGKNDLLFNRVHREIFVVLAAISRVIRSVAVLAACGRQCDNAGCVT